MDKTTKYNLLLLIPMRSVLFILMGFLLTIALGSPFDEVNKWCTIITLVCNVATIFLLLLICRCMGMSFGNFINYAKEKTSAKKIAIVVLIMITAGMGGMQITGLFVYGEVPHFPITMIQPLPMWIAILNILILPLTTTLAEDGLYLGVI